MPDAVDEVPGTAETGRDEPLRSIDRHYCGRGPGHSCPIVFEHPLKLDGQSPTVHRLDSEPSRRHRPGFPYQALPITMWTKNPSGVLHENSARIKLNLNIHFTGFESWVQSLHTGSAFSSTFFLSPSRRSLVFGPPLPVSPSSHPSLILPCRLHPPRCKLTFAVYLPWGSTPDLNTHRTLRRHSALTPREYSAPTLSGVHR